MTLGKRGLSPTHSHVVAKLSATIHFCNSHSLESIVQKGVYLQLIFTSCCKVECYYSYLHNGRSLDSIIQQVSVLKSHDVLIQLGISSESCREHGNCYSFNCQCWHNPSWDSALLCKCYSMSLPGMSLEDCVWAERVGQGEVDW